MWEQHLMEKMPHAQRQIYDYKPLKNNERDQVLKNSRGTVLVQYDPALEMECTPLSALVNKQKAGYRVWFEYEYVSRFLRSLAAATLFASLLM